ncbi:DUF6538 domain-containing protein [Brevundimonas sp.]|uniref:DUF6538 domain-containing protein n=1 Tax=Brevundimonas sp. TaxID=1871086 RepID=UPI0039184FCF
MLQQQCLNQPENGSETTTSDDAACYSNLLRKPSQRLPQPCSRPPHRRRPNPPGLIIRGRVFHVRVAVPRKVQPTVGRTEVWRSLGTGNRSEAIRKSKVVIADLERSFWAAGGISAADARTALLRKLVERCGGSYGSALKLMLDMAQDFDTASA